MEIGSRSFRQEFPCGADELFEHLRQALSYGHFTVSNVDKILRRVDASYGVTPFSWGENLSLSVSEVVPGRAILDVDSALKFGFSLTSRHQKHFRTIVEDLSARVHHAQAVKR